jgi:hypothetical protein
MDHNSIERFFFNPLKHYWILYIIIIAIGIGFIFFIPDIFKEFTSTQRIIVTSVFSVILSLSIFYMGVAENIRLQYANGLKKVISEMQDNHSRIQEFPKIIEDSCINWEKTNEWKWIGKKSSYTNWGDGQNFHLKYLPTSAYFNFVNKGFILNQEYLIVPTEHIAHFYQFCLRFNNELQSIENQIRKNGKTQQNPPRTISDPDCSGNYPSEQENLKSEANFSIDIQFLERRKEFGSKKELCNFVKCELYQYYANKNGLNDGLLGEFQIVMDSLKDYFGDDEKKDNSKNFIVKWIESWDLLKALAGLVITVIGLWYFGKSIPTFLETNYMIDISVGLSIYFVGVSLIVNALFTQKSLFKKIENQISKLSEKLEKKNN